MPGPRCGLKQRRLWGHLCRNSRAFPGDCGVAEKQNSSLICFCIVTVRLSSLGSIDIVVYILVIICRHVFPNINSAVWEKVLMLVDLVPLCSSVQHGILANAFSNQQVHHGLVTVVLGDGHSPTPCLRGVDDCSVFAQEAKHLFVLVKNSHYYWRRITFDAVGVALKEEFGDWDAALSCGSHQSRVDRRKQAEIEARVEKNLNNSSVSVPDGA